MLTQVSRMSPPSPSSGGQPAGHPEHWWVGVARVEGGGRGGDEGGEGGGPRGGHFSPLPLSPHWAGLFLMPMDTPHWLRVSVASPWNGGKS